MTYCTSCKDEVDARVEERIETFEVRGDKIKVNSHIAMCPQCGETLVDEVLESLNFDLVYQAYKEQHNLLSSSEIVEMRQKYGLSQRSLSKLLGWGEVTIHRYESGAIQDNAHETVLRLIAEPQNMRQVLDKNRTALSAYAAQLLDEKLEAMLENIHSGCFESLLATLCSSGLRSELNGFREFDVEKLEEAVLYFVSRVEHAYKTKINKLLWYADFLCYKATSQSITGSAYVAAPYGPVPEHYELLLEEITRKGLIRPPEQEFPSGSSGEVIEPCREPNMGLFNDAEQACMDKVAREFRSSTASETRRRSHKEDAYKDTYKKDAQWQSMPYSLAETLSLNP